MNVASRHTRPAGVALATLLVLAAAGTGFAMDPPAPPPAGGAGSAVGPQAPPVSPAASPCALGETGWRIPDEILMIRPVTALNAFNLLTGSASVAQVFGAAEKRAQRWFGLDRVEIGTQRVRLRKEYGERLNLVTYAGLGEASETGILAEYRTWRSWFLRSETRERGESYMELRREVRFW